jgi:hypothetical protein
VPAMPFSGCVEVFTTANGPGRAGVHAQIRHGRAAQCSALFHIRAKSHERNKAKDKADALSAAEPPRSKWIRIRAHSAAMNPDTVKIKLRFFKGIIKTQGDE